MSHQPDTTPYPRGTNKLQIASRELLRFTSERMVNSDNASIERIAALALRTVQLMLDNLDTKATDELRDTWDQAQPIFLEYTAVNFVVDYNHQVLVMNNIQARSQIYEVGKMQKHANFCRCLALFLGALAPGKAMGITSAGRAVVKAFYAGADRDKLQHAVMLLF